MDNIITKNIKKFTENYVNTILYNKKVKYIFYKNDECIDVEISILPEKYRKYFMDSIKTKFNNYIKDMYYSDYDKYDQSLCLTIYLKDKVELRKEIRKEKIKDILEES
jgi:hypothetical protein